MGKIVFVWVRSGEDCCCTLIVYLSSGIWTLVIVSPRAPFLPGPALAAAVHRQSAPIRRPIPAHVPRPKQYGAVMSLQLGFRRLVVISSAEAVKEIVKSHDAAFSSRPALAALRRLSYDGLDFAFSPYTETSREMKKISTVHLFNTKQVQTFLPIIRDEVLKMMEKIARDASLLNYELECNFMREKSNSSFQYSSYL
ncbi:5-epiaristolochene 1,3-dihydroxylase-like [Salvia miltiorrhiza]|uniref:5-epiaristolochene 1,3-dihydroxylase-like n=1 Tax=Salvia miltiorrhiza TaxID=226208 RepID=UPI0025ABF855|nr:5-epiaristolochene 1,3-dihydroxylase-like [Salvia miltiorrhiza]